MSTIELPIRYRDRWLLVVDKPTGLASQPTADGAPNLYDQLSRTERYVGLHHRLDRPASGLVLLTLDRSANAKIAAAFREHTIERSYWAAVIGDPGPSGQWDAPLDDKRAFTRWTRTHAGDGMAILEIQLETGRTHQVRRHAANAGHPLLGDRRHGGAAGGAWPRLALHACRLALTHPITGAALRVESPLPADLLELESHDG